MSVAAAVRVCMGMRMGMAVISRRGLIVAVKIPPRRRKGAQAGIAEVLDYGVDGVEGITILPVATWLAPAFAGMPAKSKIFGNPVAHDVRKGRARGEAVLMLS